MDTRGYASRLHREQCAEYDWREVALTAAAKRVIPSHLENVMPPFHQPLQKPGPPGANVDRSMAWRATGTATGQVAIRFPSECDLIDLSTRLPT